MCGGSATRARRDVLMPPVHVPRYTRSMYQAPSGLDVLGWRGWHRKRHLNHKINVGVHAENVSAVHLYPRALPWRRINSIKSNSICCDDTYLSLAPVSPNPNFGCPSMLRSISLQISFPLLSFRLFHTHYLNFIHFLPSRTFKTLASTHHVFCLPRRILSHCSSNLISSFHSCWRTPYCCPPSKPKSHLPQRYRHHIDRSANVVLVTQDRVQPEYHQTRPLPRAMIGKLGAGSKLFGSLPVHYFLPNFIQFWFARIYLMYMFAQGHKRHTWRE